MLSSVPGEFPKFQNKNKFVPKKMSSRSILNRFDIGLNRFISIFYSFISISSQLGYTFDIVRISIISLDWSCS